mmetsp:Transcript_2163/g.6839  ORF Transcript_2163/g.6839 Transcript_2163/m.6839 type:complete len:210 (-) Transcript_2163:193-822(-)
MLSLLLILFTVSIDGCTPSLSLHRSSHSVHVSCTPPPSLCYASSLSHCDLFLPSSVSTVTIPHYGYICMYEETSITSCIGTDGRVVEGTVAKRQASTNETLVQEGSGEGEGEGEGAGEGEGEGGASSASPRATLTGLPLFLSSDQNLLFAAALGAVLILILAVLIVLCVCTTPSWAKLETFEPINVGTMGDGTERKAVVEWIEEPEEST